MLNISGIENGYVIDHIKAGRSMKIYDALHLDRFDCPVAIIKNARSAKKGKKDIIKIESLAELDWDLLGYMDSNATVNVIHDGVIVEKRKLSLPKQIKGIVRCKNPRCITSIEQGLENVFILTDPEKKVYRCKYCEATLDKRSLK